MKRVVYSLLSLSFMMIVALVTSGCAPRAPAHGTKIVLQADMSMYTPSERDGVMKAAIMVIKARLDAVDIVKSTVEQQGADHILIQMPGQADQRLIQFITRLAVIEFGELTTDNTSAKWENELGRWKPATAIIDDKEKALTSRYFKENTYVTRDNVGSVLLVFEWNEEGSKLCEQITSRLIGKPMGIFAGSESLLGEDGRPIAPTVQGVIMGRGQIGGLSLNEATRLSRQLNAPQLPVPLTVVESQSY